MPKIKICGITRLKEADFLNQARVDYAGFVFYEKSKRNITISQAKEIKKALSSGIQCVAVTVSPDRLLCKQIEEAGFDILQVHGRLEDEILEKAKIPIWRACNIESAKDLEQIEDHRKIAAYVLDAKVAGSGETFGWQKNLAVARQKEAYFYGKAFVLAGGLHLGNVAEGIQIFQPDIVDVSSGVETKEGKDGRLVRNFVEAVRRCWDSGAETPS